MKKIHIVFSVTIIFGFVYSQIYATHLFRNNASNLNSGTVPNARLDPSSVTLKGAMENGIHYIRIGSMTVNGTITSSSGFRGDGSGLTNLPGSALNIGATTYADLKSSPSWSGSHTFGSSTTFTATTTFNGYIGVSNSSPTSAVDISVGSVTIRGEGGSGGLRVRGHVMVESPSNFNVNGDSAVIRMGDDLTRIEYRRGIGIIFYVGGADNLITFSSETRMGINNINPSSMLHIQGGSITLLGADAGIIIHSTPVATYFHIQQATSSLSSIGTVNDSTNPVQWSMLRNVPSGFSDGTDDGGSGGVIIATQAHRFHIPGDIFGSSASYHAFEGINFGVGVDTAEIVSLQGYCQSASTVGTVTFSIRRATANTTVASAAVHSSSFSLGSVTGIGNSSYTVAEVPNAISTLNAYETLSLWVTGVPNSGTASECGVRMRYWLRQP